MEALKDNQLLVLDILIYAFEREMPAVTVGATVREIADDVDSGLKRRMAARGEKMSGNVAEQMSYADWFAVVDAARRDPVLRALVLDSYASDERGAKMGAFRDADGRGYVIFAGTGPGEWEDDCVAAYQRDSEQQLRALAWFDAQVLGRAYAGVVASGHSKGGNKAQYLAIRRGPAVSRAVSFDGEGFSREFIAAYSDLIARNAGKIVAYALADDFVNGLLNPVVLPENRHYLEGGHVEELPANHAPFALFAPHDATSAAHALELAEPTVQGELGKLMVALTDYLQNEPSDEEFRRICAFIGRALENALASGKTQAQRSRVFSELAASADFPLTVGHLWRFFQERGRSTTPADIVRFLMPRSGAEDEREAVSIADRLKARFPENVKARLDPAGDGAASDDGGAADA